MSIMFCTYTAKVIKFIAEWQLHVMYSMQMELNYIRAVFKEIMWGQNNKIGTKWRISLTASKNDIMHPHLRKIFLN